jgi:hypothetical protein
MFYGKTFALMLLVLFSNNIASADVSITEVYKWFQPAKEIMQIYNDGFLVAKPTSTEDEQGHFIPGVELYSLDGNGQYIKNLSTVSIYPYNGAGEETPQVIFVQKDKKIVVAISAAKQNLGWRYLHLIRFLPDGSVDLSFGQKGILGLNEASGHNTRSHKALSIFEGQQDKLYVVKKICNGYECNEFDLVRLSEKTGRIDKSFGSNGNVKIEPPSKGTPTAYSLNDGFLLAVVDNYQISLFKYSLRGIQDTNFKGGPINLGQNTDYQSTEVLPDGKILLTGGRDDGTVILQRLLANGEVDATFKPDEGPTLGLFPRAVGWYSQGKTCQEFKSSLGGRTLSTEKNIYLVSPLIKSQLPSKNKDVVCSVSEVGLRISKYSADGKLEAVQDSAKLGEIYASWFIGPTMMSIGEKGFLTGVFLSGEASPDDIRPALGNFNAVFHVAGSLK